MQNPSIPRIVAAYQAGRMQQALALADAAYRESPRDPKLLGLLGLVCCQSGELRRGSTMLGLALTYEPANVGTRANYVRSLIDLDQVDRAWKAVQDAPQRTPEIIRLEAEVQKLRGDPASAAQSYRSAVEAEPSNHEAWNNLGNALQAAGDVSGAVEALLQAKQLKPKSASILLNLGRTLAGAGRFDEALIELTEAVQIEPENPQVLLEWGRLLNRLRRGEEALPILADAARLDRTNPEIFEAIGLSFTNMAQFDRAEEAYRIAIQVAPQRAAPYVSLAILLEQSNRVEEIEALLTQAQASAVPEAELAYARALVRRRTGEFREALQEVLATPEDQVDEILSAQLTGQIADRLGETDLAFDAFRRMNEAVARDPSALPFDGTEHRRYVEGLQALTTPAWVAGWSPIEVALTPPAPAFLIGFPRSGTTLLDTVLMGHPDVQVLEEEPILARLLEEIGGIDQVASLTTERANALRALYFDEVARLEPGRNARLVLDKLPLNILRVPLIKRVFPDAKLILALRHPCDVVLSCYMQNFRINRAMASFLDLTNAALLYDRVFSHWEQVRALMPLPTHIVRYESLVENLEAEVRPLLDFLELGWDERVLAYRETAKERGYIRTPSYAQVTERIYARATARWERYARQMEPVLPILAPWVERLGYQALMG